MKYCNKCGIKLNDNAKFCNKCGYEQSSESNTINRKNNIILPLAIHVNAWLVLLLTGMTLLFSVYAYSDAELWERWKDFLFDSSEPISSIVSGLLMVVQIIGVWITYIQKRYLEYILKVFYVPFLIWTLWNLVVIDYSDYKNILIGYGMIVLGAIPIIWLYLSNDVKTFMARIKNEKKRF